MSSMSSRFLLSRWCHLHTLRQPFDSSELIFNADDGLHRSCPGCLLDVTTATSTMSVVCSAKSVKLPPESNRFVYHNCLRLCLEILLSLGTVGDTRYSSVITWLQLIGPCLSPKQCSRNVCLLLPSSLIITMCLVNADASFCLACLFGSQFEYGFSLR